MSSFVHGTPLMMTDHHIDPETTLKTNGEEEMMDALIEANQSVLKPKQTASMKVLSFITGTILAFISQAVLYKALWDESILSQGTLPIVMFALEWSVLTCLFVFVGMLIQIKTLSHVLKTETLIFQIEAHYVAGAVSCVTLTWLLSDMMSIPSTYLNKHHGTVVLLGILSYCFFCAWLLMLTRPLARHERLRGDTGVTDAHMDSLGRTYRMISGLFGLLGGATSQFLLVSLLWKRYRQVAGLAQCLLVALMWNLCTIAISAMGYISLRRFLYTEGDLDGSQQLRIQLRMESCYVRSSLIGVFLAWLLMDIFMDMTDHILPSIVLLFICQLAFRAVQKFYPEDVCLEELSEQEFVDL